MPLPASPRDWRIALVGYGEVGRILAEDLRAQGIAVHAHDIRLGRDDEAAVAMRAHAAAHGVVLADSHGAAIADAALVISAVTASQTVEVARACAAGIAADAWCHRPTPPRRGQSKAPPSWSMAPADAMSRPPS